MWWGAWRERATHMPVPPLPQPLHQAATRLFVCWMAAPGRVSRQHLPPPASLLHVAQGADSAQPYATCPTSGRTASVLAWHGHQARLAPCTMCSRETSGSRFHWPTLLHGSAKDSCGALCSGGRNVGTPQHPPKNPSWTLHMAQAGPTSMHYLPM